MYVPTRQSAHAASEEAATVCEYVLVGQAAQTIGAEAPSAEE
jgi:hypothetical protein